MTSLFYASKKAEMEHYTVFLFSRNTENDEFKINFTKLTLIQPLYIYIYIYVFGIIRDKKNSMELEIENLSYMKYYILKLDI